MSEQVDAMTAKEMEFVTLVAGGQNFCIEITQIREIRRWSPVTTLPHSPDYVLGVMNLRGAVIPIIDLAAKLGFERIEPTERHVIIITAVEETIAGLLVESVSEIIGVSTDMIRDIPRGPEDATTRAILGIIAIDEEMTKIINLSILSPKKNQAAA